MKDKQENTGKQQRADGNSDREQRGGGQSDKGGKQNQRDGGMGDPRRDNQGGRSARPTERDGFQDEEDSDSDSDSTDRQSRI